MVTGCLTATIMGSAKSRKSNIKDNIRWPNAIGTSLPQPARFEKSGGPSAGTTCLAVCGKPVHLVVGPV
jgi:hypothetical protein